MAASGGESVREIVDRDKTSSGVINYVTSNFECADPKVSWLGSSMVVAGCEAGKAPSTVNER